MGCAHAIFWGCRGSSPFLLPPTLKFDPTIRYLFHAFSSLLAELTPAVTGFMSDQTAPSARAVHDLREQKRPAFPVREWVACLQKVEVPTKGNAIPSIAGLLRRLDYGGPHLLRTREFYLCVRSFPASFYTAKTTTNGSTLTRWKPAELEYDLAELACTWLYRYDNGSIFWPGSSSHPNYNKLQYPADEIQYAMTTSHTISSWLLILTEF